MPHLPPENSPEGNSRPVRSRQTAVHEQLTKRLARYQRQPFTRPFAAHSLAAFDTAQRLIDRHGGPLIFDSGCGVGDSSRAIAQQFPDHLVLGLDRSEDRLSRHRPLTPPNCHFIRTDLIDFWRLARQAGLQPARHYLLYPNPYPKPQQLKKRFHGHPVFTDLVALGGRLECRSNWKIYLDELHEALAYFDRQAVISALPWQASPLTAFEAKYQASGQTLWQLIAELDVERRQRVREQD